MNNINNIDYLVSSLDIARIFGSNVSILNYRDLLRFNNIEALFKRSPNVALLIEQVEGRGHWVGLRRFNSFNIGYFDSTGRPPDVDNRRWLVKTNHLSRLLLRWLNKDPRRKVWFNETKYQITDPRINTCGRYVIDFLKTAGNMDDYQSGLNDFKGLTDFFITDKTSKYNI